MLLQRTAKRHVKKTTFMNNPFLLFSGYELKKQEEPGVQNNKSKSEFANIYKSTWVTCMSSPVFKPKVATTMAEDKNTWKNIP